MTDAIKIIECQQVFAKNIYLDFMSKRFGITPCCITDPIGSNIKKQLCDWKALDRDIPEIQAIASEIFYPSSYITPCDDPLAPDWCKDCGYYEPENFKELLEQLEQLNNNLDELCVTRENILQEISNIEEEIQNLKDKIEKIQAEIESLNNQIISTQNTLNQKELQFKAECPDGPEGFNCETLIIEIKLLNEILAKLTEGIANFQEQLSDVESELVNFQNDLTLAQSDLNDTDGQIAKIMQQIKDIEALFCDDSECITISVIDQHGDPVKNYEIILNGGNAGVTDHDGLFYHIVPNASKNTDHTLQICYCFETEGICRQQKITITVNTGKGKEDCVPYKNCEDIKITKTIIGTPPAACKEVKSNPK